ncbi:MAG: class I SAM-dependent methyltransferase, partial [Candidatus Dormibacteraceae bacterium]
CSSAEWAEHIEHTLLPWALAGRHLGDDLLEVGPGPGATTNLLRRQVSRLTAVEYDEALAAKLRERFRDTNVTVLHGDATNLPFPDASFSAAACFTMLHHVPSAELQDHLLSEVARVVRPGGVLVGTDSLDSPGFRELHEGDVCVPIDPLTFAERLRGAGFREVELQVWSIGTRFVAFR